MTVLFSSLLHRLVAGRGFAAGFTSPFAISIYGGVKPSAAQILANWTSYNNSAGTDFLAHYVGAVWTHPGGTETIHLTPPAAANSLNTGIGTWCILWTSNVTQIAAVGGIIPNTQFIVADVSNFGGTGIIRFTDVNFTVGTSKAILSGAITVANI